jgi:hypothetical protein
MSEFTPSELRGLLGHLLRWLNNLQRAREARKRESIDALRDVILAVRRTTIYLRHVGETGRKNLKEEGELAHLWTRLGFRMEDLGLGKLAKRCDISGQHWADPARFTDQFIKQADISLTSIERLARVTLTELGTR